MGKPSQSSILTMVKSFKLWFAGPKILGASTYHLVHPPHQSALPKLSSGTWMISPLPSSTRRLEKHFQIISMSISSSMQSIRFADKGFWIPSKLCDYLVFLLVDHPIQAPESQLQWHHKSLWATDWHSLGPPTTSWSTSLWLCLDQGQWHPVYVGVAPRSVWYYLLWAAILHGPGITLQSTDSITQLTKGQGFTSHTCSIM